MKRWHLIIPLSLLVSIVQLVLSVSGVGDRVEVLAADLWFNVRGELSPPRDVVVVAMDESSYRVLGVPMDRAWPRALHAELLEKLKTYGVRRNVMDILFLGASSDPAADARLAKAMALSPTVIGADSGVRSGASSGGRFMIEELLEPPPLFSEAAERIALARLPEDSGNVRRFGAQRTVATESLPILYEAAVGLSGPATGDEYPGPRDMIWYYGPARTVSTFPIHQVLNPKNPLPRETFENKIVFIGLSLRTDIGPTQKDTYQTPFSSSGSTFGVEIQATAAANLLEGRWIRRWPAWTEGWILASATLAMTMIIFWMPPHWAVGPLVAFCLGWSYASYSMFLGGRFLPGVLLICCVLPVSFLLSTLVYYVATYRKQLQVERAFQMYLSPEMARQMRANPKGLSLGGDSVLATALFTDIEGFTSITEGMTATEVANMLNAYFTEVMNVIFENKGTLIKFIGDAVFALWGAPIKSPDHARLACETAVKIQDEVQRFNASKRFPPLNTRIGVNTGTMVVGNLGSDKRFDYTAIGDAVNLCSRLEGLNKYFGTTLLISQYTRQEASGFMKGVRLGAIYVAGKRTAVDIESIFTPPLSAEGESTWNRALSRFRARVWTEADSMFRKVAALEPRLGAAAALYRAQISNHVKIPPPETWDGEIEFTEK